MTETEAHKINELFKQIDNLTAENSALKEVSSNQHDHTDLLAAVTSIDAKLDKLLASGKSK